MNDVGFSRALARCVLSALAACSFSAHAVDGVVLIDQSRALAGGVTPGDLPGFPITLSRAGSYRLAGNLTVSDANTTAIEVTAGNVTVDLNGFEIRGPVSCPLPGSCSPLGTGRGVSGATRVTNGSVVGMGGDGVAAETVTDVFASQNGGAGVACSICARIRSHRNYGGGIEASQFGSTVVDSVVTENGLTGVYTVGSIASSTARANGARNGPANEGLRVINGSVTGSTAVGNTGVGIYADNSNVSGNSITNNGRGLFLTQARASNNQVTNNKSYGVLASLSVVIANNISLNAGIGLWFSGGANAYGNNLITDNSGGNVSGAGIQVGANVCGVGLCP
jgi:hypothetical protein